MELTHADGQGRAKMVDVSGKPETRRRAVACGTVGMHPQTLDLITSDGIAKGNVFAAARVAGIMAAKSTPQIIPMCHPLQLTNVEVDLAPAADRSGVEITAAVTAVARTGVEMEALTAAAAAALTVYDMCKAVDRSMVIGDIRLVEKTGGKSDRRVRNAGCGTRESEGRV